ncbi:MAG: acetyl/propionyl/methylcrotonyl-CoA carboxylase subunit alpha [Pseudomonadota bacterium]
MFKKILIANRGEIACRIARSCRRLGIATVAIYSDADADSLHVKLCDEAVHVGGNASSDSYLRIDRILDAIAQTGAEAVHPGFGFLSENSEFAEALEAAGVVFIGPGQHAIAVMGDKIESKKLAESAGVNTVPGHPDALDSAEQARALAEQIGCPVMLKASAGGGGKGMRIAWTLDDVIDGFTSAQNEARNAFGDDRVFIEKYIEEPRHIEIQVLADTHGNTLYLQERECSIQRRHQKVIEEAPSPFLDAATRQAMGEQAVALARAVDYRSAGTVEFIVDKHRQFYFLEMNTRLQVEHPVTEMITGLDLVEQMIRVAAGEHLAMQQSDIPMNGWSLECRVYAEDPDRNFMPSTGRLSRYAPPAESDRVRVDTGVEAGSDISMFYDPMIAKLVTWGPDRDTAIREMRRALDHYVIRGVQHNIPFLSALLGQDDFVSGALHTGFIDTHYPSGFDSAMVPGMPALSLAAACVCQCREDDADAQIEGQLRDTPTPTERVYCSVIDGDTVAVHSVHDGAQFTVHWADNRVEGHCDWQPGQTLLTLNVDGAEHCLQVDRVGRAWQVQCAGRVDRWQLYPGHIQALLAHMPADVEADMSGFLVSPMPGLLVRVSVAVGDTVKAGQELAVVEAMKMENVLSAERDGQIKSIEASAGQSLDVDQVILAFEDDA